MVCDWIGGNGSDILDTCGTSDIEEGFCGGGIPLEGESEVKLTVCIAAAEEMALLGILLRL